MEIERNWRNIPRTAESRSENRGSQALRTYKVFNNPAIVTEGWYPVGPSKKLKKGTSISFKLGAQRLVVFRGYDGQVRAMDAFCPHMGAELSRGKVEGNGIRCYFHRWKFDAEGQLTEIPCKAKLPFSLKTSVYPTEDKYAWIWVFAGPSAPYPVPTPVGLEDTELEGRFLMSHRLFVHHHVLMASAIDLQHFASVHDLHANFDLDIKEKEGGVFHWAVQGNFSDKKSWRMNLARYLLGPAFRYDAVFSGGSTIAMTYGRNQHFRGDPRRFRWPSTHLVWGVRPFADGISEVFVFVVQKKRRGLMGWLSGRLHFLLSLFLLLALKDDDVAAFPRMRFTAQNLIDQDASVAHLIRLTETLPRSTWSFDS